MDIKKLNLFELQHLKEIVQESILELSNVREINIADRKDVKELNKTIAHITNLLKNVKNEIYKQLLDTGI